MSLKSYHFDLGNSNKGPIGMCARVRATSKEEAVTFLQGALPEEVSLDSETIGSGEPGVEYIQIYINTDNIKIRHVDDIEPVEDDEVEEEDEIESALV
jgi:hypothetical protein